MRQGDERVVGAREVLRLRARHLPQEDGDILLRDSHLTLPTDMV